MVYFRHFVLALCDLHVNATNTATVPKSKISQTEYTVQTVPSHVAGGRAVKGPKGRTDIIRRECIIIALAGHSAHDNNNIILSCLIISRDGHRRRATIVLQ